MEDVLKQSQQYRLDVTYSGRAHYKAADICSSRQNMLGIPVVVMTAIVGTAIFGTISTDPALGWKISTGLVSLLAAILSALQTFFGFSERAEKHRSSGSLYGGVRRELDMFILRCTAKKHANPVSALEDLENISKKISSLASECLKVSNKAFSQAAKEIKEEGIELQTSVARIHEGIADKR